MDGVIDADDESDTTFLIQRVKMLFMLEKLEVRNEHYQIVCIDRIGWIGCVVGGKVV